MVRTILVGALLGAVACVVPQTATEGGNPSAMKSKIEKDPKKFITDAGEGVAVVRCVRDDSFFGGPNEMARAVLDGCDAAINYALDQLGEIYDVDPIVVEGTTVGYLVLYEPKAAKPAEPKPLTEIPVPPSEPVIIPERVPQPAPTPTPQ